MAETILIPVAKQILGKAAELAVEQLGLLWNFKRELQKLKDTISRIQAVLRDAEEKQFHNHQVKDWLEKLSDVLYDADDLLDDLSTEARRKAVLAAADDAGGRGMMATTNCWSLVCFLFSSFPKQLAYDLKMAHAIKAIREKLDDISKDNETLHLEARPIEEEALPPRETDSCPPKFVVGREDDKKNIIQLLLNSNREANISVVSIVGMGGMGKSTLSQLIFDDNQVQDHFDIKTWIYVSQCFDVKVILGKMLGSIDHESQVGSTLDLLQAQLRKKIEGTSFLFVLDDVWEETNLNWETLGKYLTVSALGSKVLLTTRSTKVAEVGAGALNSGTSTSIVVPYHLKGLSEKECWSLLVKKILPRKVPRDPRVKEIGKQILRKCDGVPLAVSTIAGVLADSRDPKIEWPFFLTKGLSSITKEEDPIMSALRLSFNHLPSHIKNCFSYCKLFPKGFEFNIQMLVQFWMIQRYIESEDKGFDSFKTLWWRSFFHEVVIDELGNMLTCRMHDLMHDLADSITGEKIIRSASSAALINIPSMTRHLALLEGGDNDRGAEADNDGLANASRVRTLICFKSLSIEELEQVFHNFICLRVLEMAEEYSDSDSEEGSDLGASMLSHSVDKLKHLRYLGVDCNGMEMLSDSVTNLVNLQVLNITGCHLLKELPKDIKKLVNLKHLVFDPDQLHYLSHMPKGIGELKSLQTLPVFVAGKSSSNSNGERVEAGLDELNGLNALRGKLIIRNLVNSEFLGNGVYVLKGKQHLQSLVLEYGGGFGSSVKEDILEMLCPHPNLKKLVVSGAYYGVMKLPNWVSNRMNLVELSLEGFKQCECLPPLDKLSCLNKLEIRNCPRLEGTKNNGNSGDDSDSSLNNTTMVEEDDKWPQFQCLSYLYIQDCPKLTRLPTFPTAEGELKLIRTSFQPLARTMKMKTRRGGDGGVDYSDEYTNSTDDEYEDTNIALPFPSSSSPWVHPLSKLTKLNLEAMDDLEYISSSCLISLQELRLQNCTLGDNKKDEKNCPLGVKLPSSLCSSTSLTKISISGCVMIEYLPPLHKLSSLRELIIEFCRKLKGCWWEKKNVNNDGSDDHYYHYDPLTEEEEEEEEWPHFPCLSTLRIENCPNLTQMPLFPTLEGELVLSETGSEALVRTLKMKAVAVAAHHSDSQQHSTTTTSTLETTPSIASSLLSNIPVPPLSKLTCLRLREMDDLEALPAEGLPNLTSLQELVIWKCSRLAYLPPAMRCLTSLQTLVLRGCSQLLERRVMEGGEDWPNISHIPNVKLEGLYEDTFQDSGDFGFMQW